MNCLSPLFCCDKFTFQYPGAARPAISELTCAFPVNTFTAVVGPSGSGKTTLLNLLSFLDKGHQESGIFYRQRAFSSISSGQRIGIRRQEFGFVMQDSYLLPNLTCRENLTIPLMVNGYSPAKANSVVEYAARQVHLVDAEQSDVQSSEAIVDRRANPLRGNVLDAYPNQISGGQRQRLAFLRSFIHDPAVVFADEPFTSLDPPNKARCLRLLTQWLVGDFGLTPRTDRTLIMITHDWGMADQHAGQTLRLESGRLVGELTR